MLGNKYVVESVADAYRVVGRELLDYGILVGPRGLSTKELIAPQIIITNPQSRLVYNKDRKYGIFHALTEATCLYSDSDLLKDIGRYNQGMKTYSDNGVTLYGSYGKRISKYLDDIVEKLKSDKDTRQAVLSIYESKDLRAKTKDVPCTENLQFLIRDNKLHLIVSMRSNDILFGFQYDVFMFTMLQETIANTLGIPIGYYIHNAGSLHVYEKYPQFNGYEMLDNMTQQDNNIPIKFNNNSNLKEWKALSEMFVNGYSDYHWLSKLNGTTQQVRDLFYAEDLYRKLKKVGDHTIFEKIALKNMYMEAPDWVKPFITKWLEVGEK